MIFLQVLFLAVYFGTPLFIIYRWISVASSGGKPVVWSMLAALGLWVLQAAVLIYAILICLGGHCDVTSVQEYLVYVLVLAAYIGIGCMLWLSWRATL